MVIYLKHCVAIVSCQYLADMEGELIMSHFVIQTKSFINRNKVQGRPTCIR